MSSLVKLPFTFVAAFSLHIAGTSPNPPVPKKERALIGVLETVVTGTANVPILAWGLALVEAVLILAQIVASHENEPHSLYLTPSSFLGIMMIAAGAFIRHRCYAALGNLFTFEVNIQRNHKLVTHGPYSIVRHPAYTGSLLTSSGAMLWYFSPGSLLREPRTWASSCFAILFFAFLLLVFAGILVRTGKEDRLLKKEFGAEWDTWAKRVPYKLLPGVY